MPEDPRDTLDRLLADDEAAIRDDGFSERVSARIDHHQRVRRFAVYGAGMLGFGAAVGGLTELAAQFPGFSRWVDNATSAAMSADLSGAIDTSATGWTIAAVLAGGVAFVVTSLSMQER